MAYGTFIEAFGEFSREITFLSRVLDRSPEWNGGYLNRIVIEPSDTETGKFRGAATDGMRLHIVDPLSAPDGIGLEAGNWQPLRRGGKNSWTAQIKDDMGKFPNYRHAIPDGGPLFTFELNMPCGGSMRNMSFLVKFFREFPGITAININHLNALDPNLTWEVKWYDSHKAVLFESGRYTAVMMPLVTHGF
jgi:hypothetical protein